MGQELGRSAFKLVVFNSRGRVLGTVIIDDDDQTHRAVCNDCSHGDDACGSLAGAIVWIEEHDHETGVDRWPSISIERDTDDVVRPFRQPVR